MLAQFRPVFSAYATRARKFFSITPPKSICEGAKLVGEEQAISSNADAYHRYLHVACRVPRLVDDRTWNDLEVDRLFVSLDKTYTLCGRQVLYQRLRSGLSSPQELENSCRSHKFWSIHRELAEDLRSKVLAPLAGWNANFIPVLFGNFPKERRLSAVLPALAVMPLGALVLTGLVSNAFFWLLLFTFVVNIAVRSSYWPSLIIWADSFDDILRLINAGKRISCHGDVPDPALVCELREVNARVRKLAPVLRSFRSDRWSASELTAALVLYFNWVFLLDIIAHDRALKAVREVRAELQRLFTIIGTVDSDLAVAAYLESRSEFCYPIWVEENELSLTGGTHPLISAAVASDFSIRNQSALVTGENASGKTTLLRAIGLNVILARTLGFCHARTARLSFCQIGTSIRMEEDLRSGSSYFAAEVQCAKTLLDLCCRERPTILILDELFRGTNAIERVSASLALLREMARHSLVIATTHDRELVAALGPWYKAYHLPRADGGPGGRQFSVLPGASTTTNAIQMLEDSGFPEAVTRSARKIAEHLLHEQRNAPPIPLL